MTAFSPPAGFRRLASAVEGVEVWGPGIALVLGAIGSAMVWRSALESEAI